VGSEAYNIQLSENRAKAVKDYMAEAGIDPEIISIKAYGKSSPIAPGTTDAERAQNRRVEIALTDTRIQYSGEAPQP
jgi:OOP family OmpA-OmpF porin